MLYSILAFHFCISALFSQILSGNWWKHVFCILFKFEWRGNLRFLKLLVRICILQVKFYQKLYYMLFCYLQVSAVFCTYMLGVISRKTVSTIMLSLVSECPPSCCPWWVSVHRHDVLGEWVSTVMMSLVSECPPSCCHWWVSVHRHDVLGEWVSTSWCPWWVTSG